MFNGDLEEVVKGDLEGNSKKDFTGTGLNRRFQRGLQTGLKRGLVQVSLGSVNSSNLILWSLTLKLDVSSFKLFLHTYKVLLFYVLVFVGPKKHLSREFGPHHNYHNQSQISEIFSLTQPATKTSQAFVVSLRMQC